MTVSECCLIKLLPYYYVIWKIYLYFSIGSGQPREPALCQLYRHTFVPYTSKSTWRIIQDDAKTDALAAASPNDSNYFLNNVRTRLVYNVFITNLLLSFNSEKTLIGNQRVEKLRERQRLTSTLLRVANSPVFCTTLSNCILLPTPSLWISIRRQYAQFSVTYEYTFRLRADGKWMKGEHTSTVIVLSLRAADVA